MSNIYGSGVNESLHGTSDNDYIDGGGGNDTINGHKGNDILVGNPGSNDTLIGGAGADTFTLYTGSPTNVYINTITGSAVVRCNDGTAYKLADYSGAQGDSMQFPNATVENPVVYTYNGIGSVPNAVGVITSSSRIFYDSAAGFVSHNISVSDQSISASDLLNDISVSNQTSL